MLTLVMDTNILTGTSEEDLKPILTYKENRKNFNGSIKGYINIQINKSSLDNKLIDRLLNKKIFTVYIEDTTFENLSFYRFLSDKLPDFNMKNI